MKKKPEEIIYEVGDKVYDKLHDCVGEVVYIVPNKESDNIVIVHDVDKFVSVKNSSEIEPENNKQIVEMTVEEVSKLVGKTVKIVE